MLTAISHFFLSEWLWSVTRGAYHMPINIFVMIAWCIFVRREKTIPSVLLSVSANLFSFFIFTGIVYFFKVDYIPGHDEIYVITSVLSSCMYLGVIYATLQSIFFFMVRRFYTFNLISTLIAAYVSNLITAWIMYRVL